MNWFATYYGKSRGSRRFILDKIEPFGDGRRLWLIGRNCFDNKFQKFLVSHAEIISQLENLPSCPIRKELFIRWVRTPGSQPLVVDSFNYLELFDELFVDKYGRMLSKDEFWAMLFFTKFISGLGD